jgi:hypothetical protein
VDIRWMTAVFDLPEATGAVGASFWSSVTGSSVTGSITTPTGFTLICMSTRSRTRRRWRSVSAPH